MGEVGRGMLKAPKQPFSSSGSQSSNVGWSILKWQRRRPVIDVYPALRGKPSDRVPKGGGAETEAYCQRSEKHTMEVDAGAVQRGGQTLHLCLY
jgi:hypothetical protein